MQPTAARATTSTEVVAVILCWNGITTLPEVVEAVARQSHGIRRVIIVDNGSTDGSREWIQEHARGAVSAMLLASNLGVGAGHNAGWQAALDDPGCTFIWSLEHDCVPEPDCLRQLVRAHRMFGASGRVRLAGATPIQLNADLLDPRPSYAWRRGRFQRLPKLSDYAAPFINQALTFNGTLFHADAVREVGLLRPDFFATFEDYDYRRRMADAGYVLIGVPGARVRHDLRKAHPVVRAFGRTFYLPGGNSVERSYYASRNSTFLQARDAPRRRRFVMAALARLAGSLAWITLRGPDRRRRLRARYRAVMDGLQGRLGPRDEAFFR
jgi:GT2 family glycosyltransferase